MPRLPKLFATAAVLTVGLLTACPSDPAPETGQKSDDKPAEPVVAAANPHEPPPMADDTARDVTPSGETRAEVVEGMTMVVPQEWERAPARSSMRKAEFVLPGPGGDVRLVVYRFEGGAGGGAANIERWKGQVEPPDGVVADAKSLEVGDLKISAVDVSGHFVGQSMPGAPPQAAIDDARLLAAAIEGWGDPFYLKLVGARATIDLWAPAWDQLLAGLAVAEEKG